MEANTQKSALRRIVDRNIEYLTGLENAIVDPSNPSIALLQH
jgi:hypothetical protein